MKSAKPEFGVSSTKYKGQKILNKSYSNASSSLYKYGLPKSTAPESSSIDQRFQQVIDMETIEQRFGFDRYQEGPERLGWLINMHMTIVKDADWPGGKSAVDYYFINDNCETFKATMKYSPYFYIGCKVYSYNFMHIPGTEQEVEDYLSRRFDNVIEKMQVIQKKDLKQPDHLIGNTRNFIRLTFRNQNDLMTVRRPLIDIVQRNQKKAIAVDTYADYISETNRRSTRNVGDTQDYIMDIREYDVPYYVRVAIDLDIRVGLWYIAKAKFNGEIELTLCKDLVHRPEPIVFAFDIETSKSPLKFPDMNVDPIMMISYMIDGNGYLITNREIVSKDIEDFEYTPKPEFEGPFTIFNEPNEEKLLRRFFEHIQSSKPTIYVTYNGDFFDWPYIEERSKLHGIDMYQEIGVYRDEEKEYKCKHASHMDAFKWVKRDSYLPQGSQGLKAVTTSKLGYNPIEVDPEDMTRFASEQPQTLAQYSVSDAVATYYLYMKYVHPFIFSLCNIIPLVPDEVLRKGTGALCELLLMVEAYRFNIIIPNKHINEINSFYEGHLLESETYVGGHVEALEAGVFRSDISTDFKIDPSAAQQLIDQLDDALQFTIRVEEKKSLSDIVNYDEVKAEIQKHLEDLRDQPKRNEPPLIYHLDVAAMYPNIILTNRLQPDAMVDESVCATCEFNLPEKKCDRRMKWSWRGDYLPAKRDEYRMIENQLVTETFPPKYSNQPNRSWNQLTEIEQSEMMRQRLTDYSKKVYSKAKETRTVEKESIVCQREDPFYVETVRAFRDRRYEYKGLHKKWKGKLDDANKEGSITKAAEAKNMIVLYDSLQLAHKVILNSFYGYVMKKGARWHSLEMAGIVCLTGSNIIQMARQLVERIGRPLELDTDGIWCILPKSFPETFSFTLSNGKSFRIDYPCTMLNHLVHAKFTNDQYHRLTNPTSFEYSISDENSIFFEIDGPYRAMILPTSTAEDKLLKKRYAVFNKDGTLAELKGFEVKRRGELKLIKIFQTEIFDKFLEGKTLEECYSCVATVANRWLDVLFSKAVDLTDEELFELISENRSMSKTLEDYGTQKSTAIRTAKRLAEFLGDEMVKDKGLACKFIISSRPYDLPVSDRAIPIAIFHAESAVKKRYLRKWLNDNSLETFDIRDILDWNYYIDRFGSAIQKIITIPAAMQKVKNPVPRLKHPEWLSKRVEAMDDKLKQYLITNMFDRSDKPLLEEKMDLDDIEELGVTKVHHSLPKIATVHKRQRGDNSLAKSFEDLSILSKKNDQFNLFEWDDSYSEWLEYQKRKWRKQRLMKAQLRSGDILPGQHNTVMGALLNQRSGSLLYDNWEIVQIAPTDILGEYRAWVLVVGELYDIRLTVPRIVYLNSQLEDADTFALNHPSCQMSKCTRTLPRSRRCFNLFRMTLPEQDYIKENQRFTNIFNIASTEDIYETQLPLLERAILQLGSVCKIDTNLKGFNNRAQTHFNMNDLVGKHELSKHYMKNPGLFEYIYLYHSRSENRHFFTLMGSTLSVAQVFVVGVKKSNAQIPNITKMYQEYFTRMIPEEHNRSSTVKMPETMNFETYFFTNEADALKSINKALGSYIDKKRGKSLLAISSPQSSSYLAQYIRKMSQMPYLTVSPPQEDNTSNALHWIQPSVKNMLTSYLHLGDYIDEKVKMARYADIPVCNLLSDSKLYIADITFARKLIENDMIIWWSPDKLPDLGGREQDETLDITNEVFSRESNFPGVYENICVTYQLYNLCLNTILVANIINDLEGTSQSMGFDTFLPNVDGNSNNALSTSNDGTVPHKAFNILRSLVQKWVNDSKKDGGNVPAELLQMLHYWLLSQDSNMHDPSLYNIIIGMMRKVYMQLISYLKKMKITVVFSNSQKLILKTPKETPESAMAILAYISSSLQKSELFKYINLKQEFMWDVLVWMDEMNFSGIKIDANNIKKEPIITIGWNISEYIPPVLQPIFVRQSASFTFRIYKAKREHPIDIKRLVIQSTDDSNSPRLNVIKNFINVDLTRKVLNTINDITQRMHKKGYKESDDFQFPKLVGTFVPMTDPILEYTKTVCAILELDSRFEAEAQRLKKNCLVKMGNKLSEFNPVTEFRHPCEYFNLLDVPCTHCGRVTDADFIRNKSMKVQSGERELWICTNCKKEYDIYMVEMIMIAQIQNWLSSYQNQDLYCTRCHTVKVENMREECDKCGRQYSTTQSKSQIIKRIQILRSLGQQHRLTCLSDYIDNIFSLLGDS
ncbi:hypothetical protein BDB01DRAFT_896693 [Pilobolus umbonatus]|nr:hypothetical protein BDB01DRAFT_896693 [Pilobolus umbonatus]